MKRRPLPLHHGFIFTGVPYIHMNCCAPSNHQKEHIQSPKSTRSQIPSIVKYLLLAGGILIILRLFRIPLATALPYSILLLCPLMHVFMMKDHGGHDHSDTQAQGQEKEKT